LKDPDYGLYCVLKKQNVALNTYYYHRDRKICMSTDLPRMRFIDYVLGERNIYDEPIIPQEYKCPVAVSGRGQLMLTHKNKRIGMYLLQALAGKRPVFIPVVDEEYGYKIYVHDSDKYEYDKAREPDIVLIRNTYSKTLIPVDKVELYLKKELLDKKFASAEEMMLVKIDELTRLSKQSPDSCIEEALKDLDFKSLYYTQPYINTAILTALFKLPAEYKNNLELARKISHALDYKGRYKKPLLDAVRQYFSSIPDEYVFQPFKKHSSKTRTFNDDEDDDEEKPLLLLDKFKKDISKYRQLTALGEIKLGVLKELGEVEAKEDFINSNYGLLVSVARNYEWSGFSILDLVQDGYFGLLRAIEKYKPQKEYKFSTYATPWIKAVIMRAIYAKKNQIRLPEFQITELNKLKTACVKANLDLYDKKTNSLEISQKTGFDIEQIDNLRNIIYAVLSFDQPLSEDDDEFTLERILDKEDTGYDVFEKKQTLIKIVQEATKRLLKTDDKEVALKRIAILKMRLIPLLIKGEYMTLKKLGVICGVSRERIRQMEPDVIETLSGAIKGLKLTQEDLYVPNAILGLQDQISAAVESLVSAASIEPTGRQDIITPHAKPLVAMSKSALRPLASKDFKELDAELIDVKTRIANWYCTGEGLRGGDYIIANVDLKQGIDFKNKGIHVRLKLGVLHRERQREDVI
ncbi:MAG: sigma-70 family RNA polymerase sigma factor, partial [Candidatus Omnitrophota bacterium]